MKAAKYLAALALCAGPAHAEFMDGNKLYERMTSGKNTDYAMTLGYIIGVADTMQEVAHCAPPNVTAGQLIDMVKLHLEQNPSQRNRTGDLIVIHVLKTAWPCRRGAGT